MIGKIQLFQRKSQYDHFENTFPFYRINPLLFGLVVGGFPFFCIPKTIRKGMCVNFLCLILSENWSKINPIYYSNFGLWESILGNWSRFWVSEIRFWASASRFCASKGALFSLWESIFCPGSRFLSLLDSNFSLWRWVWGLWSWFWASGSQF